MDGQSQKEGVVSTGGQVGGGLEGVQEEQSHDTLSVEVLSGMGLVGDCVGWTVPSPSCPTEAVSKNKK